MIKFNVKHLPVIFVQKYMGDPVVPGEQEHIGTWFITSHIASVPQVPTHGLTHLLFIQALSREQSELRTHSGLQPK